MTRRLGTAQPPTVGLVSVGNELLFGQTEDTNASWLARNLSDLGLQVRGRWVVGDVEDEIQGAVKAAMEVAEVVVLTGGLGPTHDDLTRESVASLLGVHLELDPTLLKGLEARFRALGFETLPEGSRSMASSPRPGSILPNPRGAAPGIVLQGAGARLCILLPGVPREMRAIFEDGVAPLIRERFEGRLSPVIHRVIHTAGIPESVLAAQVEKILPAEPGPVSLAYLPDVRGVRLRFSTRAFPDGPAAEARMEELERLLEPALAGHRYEADSGDLAEAVGNALLANGTTLAVAESCTGGLISKRITDRPGSSRYFLGGVVAYDNVVKEKVLGVEEDAFPDEGAVSEEVARAMARGVAGALGAHVGMGVTGIAGPGGGTPEKPVGTVWYAVSSEEGVVSRRGSFPGDREAIRERAAQTTLSLLLHLLEGREGWR